MIVKIKYDNQRLDVFDTATFTSPLPLGKNNMLTNFEVKFDALGEQGLWVHAHGYDADPAYKTGDTEVPVARRKKGWSFLVAAAEELQHVDLVAVDGEEILKRIQGELVDVQSLNCKEAYENWGDVNEASW